ncbi:MAG TPA: ester cyclase [Acidobacteriaceae bacterium]
MSNEANLAALNKFAEAANTGNFQLFYDVVLPACIDHDAAPGQAHGPEGYCTLFAEFRIAFPDFHAAPDTIVADDDSIALAYTMTGTHNGPLMGFPPTGKKMKIRGVQIFKFKEGKVIERWGSSDELGMLQQLGITQTPKAASSVST